MSTQPQHISKSIEVLSNNLFSIVQVREWADFMGYQKTKKFSRRFLRYYAVRPCKILVSIRLKSIYKQLRFSELSNFNIAREHGLSDEIALNKFVNYHLDCCPRVLAKMSKYQFREIMEKFGSKIR